VWLKAPSLIKNRIDGEVRNIDYYRETGCKRWRS
jgi:hypothetical protein